MSTNHIISVTADDIKHGVRGKCQTCPVALAVARALNLLSIQIRVEPYYVTFRVLDATCFSDLPGAAQTFIRDFDIGLPVEPFSFELDVSHGVI